MQNLDSRLQNCITTTSVIFCNKADMLKDGLMQLSLRNGTIDRMQRIIVPVRTEIDLGNKNEAEQ